MKLRTAQKGFTLIELLVVIGILAILFSIVLIAINPARQFGQANNTKRRSDTLQILNTITQYGAEKSGALPTGLTKGMAAPLDISNTGADLCAILSPTYISAFPVDPAMPGHGSVNGAGLVAASDCATGVAYDSGYQVQVDAAGRVTVTATKAEQGEVISISR